MASLNEIKSRISSVRSTLKITSAMKLVASAKLRKAQSAIGDMIVYQKRLEGILFSLVGGGEYALSKQRKVDRVAVVAFSSNSSLCGAFNANAVHRAREVIDSYRAAGIPAENITVYSVGKKMADAMRKLGFRSPADFRGMAGRPSYEEAAALAVDLMDKFLDGTFDKVDLVYNHYKSISVQPSVAQTYLPISMEDLASADAIRSTIAEKVEEMPKVPVDEYILEPGLEELVEALLPRVMRLKIYTALLDSNAAEHAARMMAMQTATDNGNDLLAELSLEYNKGRQQKITNEILDLASGTAE